MPVGPRVTDLKLGTSSEGTPLPRVYGKARVAGQLIWATRFKEKKEKVKQQTAGGKNVGGTTTGSGKTAKTIKYTYFANVAYALCEGPIDRIGTIWADGKKLKKDKFNFDVYLGTETQTGNSLIAAARRTARCRAIAAPPMSCSRTCRSRASATGCRSSISRCCGRSMASRRRCGRDHDPGLGRVRL